MATTRPEYEHRLYNLWYNSSPSASESPSGVLLVLSGILSDQAEKLERMAILQSWAWLPQDHDVKKFGGLILRLGALQAVSLLCG